MPAASTNAIAFVLILRKTPDEGFPLCNICTVANSPFLRFLYAGISPTAVGDLGLLALRTIGCFLKKATQKLFDILRFVRLYHCACTLVGEYFHKYGMWNTSVHYNYIFNALFKRFDTAVNLRYHTA